LVYLLIQFIDSATSSAKRVKLASGHITSDVDADEFLNEVYDFLCRVEEGKVEPRDTGRFRDEDEVKYERDDGKISFSGPEKKFRGFVRR
jgi:hypothetical protein